MAIEAITAAQAASTAATEQICTNALMQAAQQEAIEQAKKAKEMIDQAQQLLAEIPEKAIEQLVKTVDFLLSIIDGHINVEDPAFDPSVIIAQLEAMLNPIIGMLSSLPVPEIPGLAQLQQLLNALKSLISLSESSDSQMPIPKVEIPQGLVSVLNSILAALQRICYTLPLIFINLIFQMLNVIIGLFKQIAGIIGVPSIPYPLSLVPNCITMMPDMMQFIMQAPGKLYDTAYATLKKVCGKLLTMQVPTPPTDIQIPQSLPTCPEHG